MKVLTYIYSDFENEISSTHQFRRSCARWGYDVVNVLEGGIRFQHHHQIIHLLRDAVAKLDPAEPVCYADGADTFFLRPINVPTDKILYSTERAYWPPHESIGGRERYDAIARTPWPYLNGGAYCGPARLLLEWYDKYLIPQTQPHINAQAAQHNAYFAAVADGFPIELDQECAEFQSIAFDNDFQASGESAALEIHLAVDIDSGTEAHLLYNKITANTPALIHGNGRTPMGRIYELLP